MPADGRSLIDRATATEQALRAACGSYGGDWGEAMLCLLGLAQGTHGALLKDRRRQAADLLEVSVETFRRHIEPDMTWDIVVYLPLRLSGQES
jgi:hypothetical protein